MGFDDQEAAIEKWAKIKEERRNREPKKEEPKMECSVMIVLFDEDEPHLIGGIRATGRDDAIAKAILSLRIEETRVDMGRCRVKDSKTGKIL